MIGKLYIPDLRAAAEKRPEGYLDEVLSAGRIENDVVLHIDHEAYLALRRKYSPRPVATVTTPLEGAGTELKKLLAKLGLEPAVNCKCTQHIHEMNHNGVEWCEQNIDTIIGWLKEEADRVKQYKQEAIRALEQINSSHEEPPPDAVMLQLETIAKARSIPFTAIGAKILVKRAISNAKKRDKLDKLVTP